MAAGRKDRTSSAGASFQRAESAVRKGLRSAMQARSRRMLTAATMNQAGQKESSESGTKGSAAKGGGMKGSARGSGLTRVDWKCCSVG